MQYRTMKYVVIVVAAAVVALGVAVYQLNYAEEDQGNVVTFGGASQGSKIALDGATTTLTATAGAAKVVDVGDYSDCTITTGLRNAQSMNPTQYYSFKVRGASEDSLPNLKSAATWIDKYSTSSISTTKRLWDYVKVTDLKTSSSTNGGNAINIAKTDITRRFSIDDDNIRYLLLEVSVASTTASTTAPTSLNAWVDCQE